MVTARYDVATDAVLGQRGAHRCGQTHSFQRGMDLQGDPPGNEIVVKITTVSVLLGNDQTQALRFDDTRENLDTGGRLIDGDEDETAVASLRGHVAQQL